MLAIIGRIGTAGGTGYAIEFGGDAIRALSMEGRMTVCNMAIEAGARAGMVAVDDTTIDYLQGPAVRADGRRCGTRAVEYWRTLDSDPGAQFDRRTCSTRRRSSRRSRGARRRRWWCRSTDRVPDPDRERDSERREGMERALDYMGLSRTRR